MFEEREILPSFEYLFIKFCCIFNFHIYIDKIRNRNKNDSMFNKIRGIALFVISFSLKTKKRILILSLYLNSLSRSEKLIHLLRNKL